MHQHMAQSTAAAAGLWAQAMQAWQVAAWVPATVAFQRFIYGVHEVGGRSMQPTLNSADEPNAFGINDFVLVEKWTSRAHWYRRGDVVLLRCAPGQKSVLLLPLVHCSGSAASACGAGATSQSNALERPRAPPHFVRACVAGGSPSSRGACSLQTAERLC